MQSYWKETVIGNPKISIIGLGLIGGSIAKALKSSQNFIIGA